MIEIAKIHDKKYKNIFFDIFDTVISRTITPEYTKKVWANHIVKRFSLKQSIIELYELRNKLEYKLGEKNASKGNDWEFTYTELCDSLYDCLKLDVSKEEFKKISKELEIEIESTVLEPEKDIIEEIKKARKENKKIYCISDMYLEKEMIKEIFSNLKILELFDDIFVSCEYKKNKKSTALYKYALDKLKVKPEECIMVGDNKDSDFTNAKKVGIEAIHIDRSENYKLYEEYDKNQTQAMLEAKFKKCLETKNDKFEHVIFTLYQFIEKLYYELRKNNYEEVFFLSREGEYLKKLFDEFQKKIYGKKLKTNYILVSRKATYLPSLKPIKEEKFGGLLQQYNYISLKEFLGSLNFTDEEKNKILNSYRKKCEKLIKTAKLKKNEKEEMQAIINKDYDKKIIYLYESKLLTFLKEDETFIQIYEENRKEQNKFFKKYIEERTSNKRICVVDIGWNGSIQDNIGRILGKEYEVNGYLYGLVTREDPRKVAKENNKQGLIFTNVPDNSKNFDLFIENRTIFEVLLGASHGSANRYIEKNNKIEVSTFEKQEEKDIYTNVISIIQDEMMVTFKKLLEILPNGYYDNKKIDKEINIAHFNMLFNPTEEQLNFFDKIYHYENFGVFEFSEFNLKKELTLKYYIKENAKYFLKHKSFFYDAFWPVLKLYNEKLFIPRFFYINGKKIKLKRKGVI